MTVFNNFDNYYRSKTVSKVGSNVCEKYEGDTVLNVFFRYVGNFNTVEKIRTGNRVASRFQGLKISVMEESVRRIDTKTQFKKIKPIKEFNNNIKLVRKYTYNNKY